jgi:hypothetical protein
MTSCTLTQRAFLNPNNYFGKGAKTTEVSPTASSLLCRGGGCECDEGCHTSIHCKTIVHILVSNLNRAFPWEERNIYMVTLPLRFSETYVMYCIATISRYVHIRTMNLTS